MNKRVQWQIVWDSHCACYQLSEQTDQERTCVPLESESRRWKQWLSQVSSFTFQSKDGTHFTALKERRTRGGAYWTAYRKVQGKFKCKYLGVPQEITLSRLERVSAALAERERQPVSSRTFLPGLPAFLDQNGPEIALSDQAQKHLLETKFFVPTSLHTLLARPRLTSLLDEGIRRQLTLVSAPAGFGKTSLLAHWVHSLSQRTLENQKVAWVSLDVADKSAVQFWTYVLTALERSEPGIAISALQMVQNPHIPALEEILTTFINVLSQATNQYVLILDDYYLADEQAIHTSLNYLLEHQPPQLHLILLTRIDPPLNLSRLRVRGQMLEIRTDQLRCTTEEAAAFLKEIMGIKLAPEMLHEMIARTEGWLVGLQLLGLSLQTHPSPTDLLPHLDGSQRYLLDYLTEEVLRQQPAAVQQFLLRTSLLERLNASLCDAVIEHPGSQQMLEYLERANLFVVPLGEQRCWYRYHALFADALRARLEQDEEEDLPALHLRASQWYASRELLLEAIHHALQAHAWQRAAELIEPFTEVHLWKEYEEIWGDYEEIPLMLRWLRQIPVSMVQTRPRLALYYARNLFFAGHLREIEPWVQAAEATLLKDASSPIQSGATPEAREEASAPHPEDHEHEQLLGEVAARRAIVAALYGDYEGALDRCQQALSHLSEQDIFQQSLVCAAQGQAAFGEGQILPATHSLLEAGALMRRTGMPGAAINYLCMAASFLHLQGRLHEARQVLQQAIALGTSSEGQPFTLVGVAYTCLADVLREWNKLDEALDLALQGLQMVEQAKYTLNIDRGYLVLVRIYLSRGEIEAANATFQRALQLPTLADNAYRRSWLTAVEQARLWIALGEQDHALHWAREWNRVTPQSQLGASFARERETVARVRLLLAQQQPERVQALLAPSVSEATRAERWGSVLEMRLLQAQAAQMSGKEQEAFMAISRAVGLGEAEGYIQSFVDEGPRLAALLARLRKQPQEEEHVPYLDTLLAAFPREGVRAKPQPQPGLLDPLSARELEVLRELACGATNQEVAETLVLSVQTVKRHVGNIFGKLEVNNRTQAVARARKLGLLSDEQQGEKISPSRAN
ncbi:LuxR family transcriptional regulator [Ktedonobacteria bacterium brp13]|nr:LuxR family transcriptional regulator [Ktedonobacteria bacterium brp13]